LVPPQGYARSRFPFPLDNPGVAAPHVVQGFAACMWVPGHFSYDLVFVSGILQDIGVKHDRCVDLSEEMSDENPTSRPSACYKYAGSLGFATCLV